MVDGGYNISKRPNLMKSFSFHVLRVGTAITFLWIGILIFQRPESWGGYLQPWAAGLLPIPLKQAMIGTAILDIAIGVFLLIDVLVWLASLIGTIHLIIVLAVSGITDITIRDIAILTATIALMADSLPSSVLNKLSFWKKTTQK